MKPPAYLLGKSIRDKIMSRRIPEGIERALNAASDMPARMVGRASRVPINVTKDAILASILGSKARFGPMRGRRLSAVPRGRHGGNVEAITRAEFAKLQSGELAGKAYKARIGGRDMYFKKKYEHGGALGMAKRHPFIAAGGLLVGHQLLTNPRARAYGGAATADMRPRIETDPYVAARFGAGEAPSVNPFARSKW